MRWLQDKPWALSTELDGAARSDLRVMENADRARALMHCAKEMIRREILSIETVPQHLSLKDRLRDSWNCFRGRAYILRTRESGRSWEWPPRVQATQPEANS